MNEQNRVMMLIFRVGIVISIFLGFNIKILSQTNTVYRYDPYEMVNGQFIPATSIPPSLPNPSTARLIYVLSINSDHEDGVSIKEWFSNLNPSNGFVFHSSSSQSSYFALVDGPLDNITFYTKILIYDPFPSNYLCCTRSPVGIKDFAVGEMINLGDFASGQNKMWVGVSPTRPNDFIIKDESETFSIDKATEKDTIVFNFTSSDVSIDKFIVEKSLDDGITWSNIGNRDNFNISKGYRYIVEEFKDISVQESNGAKRIKFRARSYVSSNRVVGRSYGYIEKSIDVFPKPTCNTIPTKYYCSTNNVGISSFTISNINSLGNNVNAVIVNLEKLTDGIWERENWKDSIPKSELPKNLVYGDKEGGRVRVRRLDEGKYRIVLENQFVVNGYTYQSGHSYWPFEVEQRVELKPFIREEIEVDCSYSEDSVNLFKTDSDPPNNITIQTCNSTYTNCTTISPQNFTVSPGTYYLKAYYNESPTCEEKNISVSVINKYPEISIEKIDITYGCPGKQNYFLLPDNGYTIVEGDGTTYIIKYKVGTSDWFVPSAAISSDSIGVVTNNEVIVSVGVFVGNEKEPKCTYTKGFPYTPRQPISFNKNPIDLKYCDNANNGKITLSNLKNAYYPCDVTLKKAGELDETIQWENGQSSKEFNGLRGGNYEIQLTDNTGCIYKTTENIDFVETPFSITSVSTTDVSPCSDSKNGSIKAVAAGEGSGLMQVSIYSDTWVNSNTISSLGKGTYTVYARPGDLDACIISRTAVVNGPEPIILTTKTTINPSCNGLNDGSIVLEHSPFERTVTYQIFENNSWKNLTGNQASNLSNDLYKFRAIDNNSCQSSEIEVTLSEPDQLAIILEPPVPPLCHGENGSISFSCSGGTSGPSGYNYTINGDNAINVSGTFLTNTTVELPHGDYLLTIEDTNGCSTTSSFSIIQPILIRFNYSLKDYNGYNIDCHGNNETLSINLSGGTPFNYGYKFTSPSNPDPVLGNPFTINDLKGDTNYTFSAEDENGCIETLNLTLTQPDTLKFSIPSIVNPTCDGNKDGQINIIVNGGVDPYKVFYGINTNDLDSLEITQPNSTINSLHSGKYLLYAKDKNECRFPKEDNAYEITTLSAPNPMSISIDNIAMPTCNGKLDGSIKVTLTGRENKIVELIRGETVLDSLSGNSDSFTFSGLSAGSYTIKFTEEAGVCNTSEDVTIDEPQQLSYFLTSTNASCFDSNTGMVEVGVFGGNLPYSIGLINESTTPTQSIDGDKRIYTFKNLKASEYQIELSDSIGCPVEHPDNRIATVLNPPTSLGLALEQQPAHCYGAETGQILASSTGGWGEYLFSIDSLNWNGPFTEFTFDELSSNSYRILVRDSMNCVVEQSIEVEQPLELIIDSVVIEPVSCSGGGNGTIEVIVSGGNGGYEYNFNGDFVNHSKQTQLISGDYNIIVKDSKGCETTQSVFVPEPQPFSLTIDKNTYNGGYNISCYGQTDTVWLTPSGATTPYLLAYDNGFLSDLPENNQITISELVANIEYSFTFTDENGCEYIESISLIEPDTLSIENIYLTEPNCHNGSDGSIEVKGISGGAKSYTLTLEGHQTNYSKTVSSLSDYKFEDLKSDDKYELTITDSNGCSISRSIILNQPSQVIVEKIDVNHVTCKEDSTGSVVAQTIGGKGAYKYYWYNDNEELVSTLNPLDNQPAGTYKFSTKDINGCLAINPTTNDTIFTVTIEEPLEKLIINDIIATQPTCYGLRNGILSIESTGGWNSDHKYSLNSSAFIQDKTFKNLSTQNYTVKVTDDKGCIIEQNVYLAQPDSFELTAQIVDIDCYGNNNGVINLTAIGGNGDYLFGFKDSTQNIFSSFENLKAGSFDFWAKDKKGCTAFLSAIVNQPEKIGINSIILESPTCGETNGTIEVIAHGGIEPYSVNWISHDLPSTLLAENLNADIYYFTLSDINGCSVDSSVILNSLNGPVINVSSILEPSCSYRNDGSIEILIEGDAEVESISWTNSKNDILGASQNLTSIGKGNYFVKVSDINNCITSIEIALNAPNPITASISKTPVICADDATGTSTIEITGGTLPYSVNWFNNDNEVVATGLEVQVLSVGSYYASISDQNGCGLTSDANNITPIFHINEPQQPLTLTLEDIQKPTCFGGNNAQISLKADGGWSGYSFAIDGQSPSLYPIFGNLASGEYVATVTDENGCIVSLDITVDDPLPVSISLLEQVNVRCSGGNEGYIRVSATNGLQPFNYSITNGTTWNSHGAFNQLTNGNYTIIARDINQCASTIDVAVMQPESLVVSIDSLSASYCGSSNGFVSFVPQGGVAPYKMQWDNQPVSFDFTVDNLPLGSYVATIFDTNQCTTAVQIDIAEVDGPKINSHSVITPKCHNSTDGALQIDFDGISTPFTYFLNGMAVESSNITEIPAGNYKFRVVDNFGCADSININLSAPEPISITLTDITHPLCFGYNSGSIMANALGGTPPLSFEWSNGNTSEGLQNIGAGEYQLLVTDENLCSDSVTVNIVDPEQIAIDLPKSISLCQGQVAVLDAQNPGSMYWWSSSNGLESYKREITVNEAGEYYLQVTNEFGCFALDTVKIEFFDYTVNSTLLVPSTAMVGDTIVIIDISWPIPNEIEWIIPNEFTVLVDNPYDKQLIPNAEGTFTIGLISYTGECMALSEKSIVVSGFALPPIPKEDGNRNRIESIKLAPNPAKGFTNVEVILSDKADISIELINGFGTVIRHIDLEGLKSYSYQMPLNDIPPGVYLVKVGAFGASKAVRLIVL